MNNLNCSLCKQSHLLVSIDTIYFAMINSDTEFLQQINLDSKKFPLKSVSPPQPPHKAFALHTSPDIFMVLIVAVFLLVPLLFSQNLSLEQAIGLVILFVFYLAFRKQILNWQINREENYHNLLAEYKQEIKIWQDKVFCPVKQTFFTESSAPDNLNR